MTHSTPNTIPYSIVVTSGELTVDMYTRRPGGAKNTQNTLELTDRGLRGAGGAQQVIAHLKHGHFSRLLLDHNELGDEGVVAICTYLTTNTSPKLRINEISFVQNGVTNDGKSNFKPL